MSKNLIVTLFAGLTALILTACDTDPKPTESESKFSLQTGIVDVPAAGGEFSVGYSVENPIEGVSPEIRCDEEWIKGLGIDESGKIVFTVGRNALEKGREAVVAATYSKPEIGGQFIVRQAAGGAFVLDALTVEAGTEGGRYSITYTYSASDGAVPDTRAIKVSSSVGWVSNFDTSAAGTISFDVESNAPASKEPTGERRGLVVVTFASGGAEQSFTVVQHGGERAAPFAIGIDNVTYKNVTYSVRPVDKDMTYVTMVISVTAFDRYPTDEEYFLNELGYFRFMSEIHGISLDQYLTTKVLKSGDSSTTIGELQPETQYYVYAYGLSPKGERLTDIIKTKITTGKIEMIGMTFEFDWEFNAQVQKTSVIAVPGPAEFVRQHYYFGMMRTEGIPDDLGMDAIMQGYINYVIESFMINKGGTVREAMELIAYQGIGVNIFESISGQEYVIFAGALDMDAGLVISDVAEERFTAPDVRPSDNVITLEVAKEGFTTADIKITTTTNDLYAFLAAPENYFAGMSDAEILADLSARDLSKSTINGNYTVKFTDRVPGQSYYGYAFGYTAGVATTGLSKVKFSVHDFKESDVEMKVLHDKYFDAKALKAAYPEEFANMPGAMTVVLPVHAEVTPSTAGAKVWYNIYPGDHSNNTAVYRIGETLLAEGCPLASTNFFLPYEDSLGKPHTLIGMVADAEGRFGGLFREVVTFTREGMSPVSEYVSAGRSASTETFHAPVQASGESAADSRFNVESLKKADKTAASTDHALPAWVMPLHEFVKKNYN